MLNFQFEIAEGRNKDTSTHAESTSIPILDNQEIDDGYDMLMKAAKANDEENQKSNSHAVKVLKKPPFQRFKDNVWYEDKTWIRMFFGCSIISAILGIVFEPIPDVILIYKFSIVPANVYGQLYQDILMLIVLRTKYVAHLIAYSLLLLFLFSYSIFEHLSVPSHVSLFPPDVLQYTGIHYSEETGIVVKVFPHIVDALYGLTFVLQSWVGLKLIPYFRKATGEQIGNNIILIRANKFFKLHRTLVILLGYLFSVRIMIMASEWFMYWLYLCCLSPFIFLASDFCASREKYWWSITFFVVYFGMIVSVLWTMVRFDINDVLGYVVSYLPTGITLISLLVLVGIAIKVLRNFKKGLYHIHAHEYNWAKFIPGVAEVQESADDIDLSSIHDQSIDDAFQLDHINDVRNFS
ncbi:unnamed protein product [Ambrosiozyma monospora]|uniref:Unnamed protein product n=1 Tax=Ambrosiozyma monospora TaxID=43982 RepID=A0ACB5T1N0_AMBMO|nr:unnamed protein product [Ambrosiozyma monospora]